MTDFQISDSEAGSKLGSSPAEQRSYPGLQLREGERFHEIIVGSTVKSKDAIFHRILSSQQQDGNVYALLTEAGQDFKSVSSREHHVQDRQFESVFAEKIEAFLPGTRDLNVVLI